MALVLERRFPEFQASLLTAVELSGRNLDPADWSRDGFLRRRKRANPDINCIMMSPVTVRQVHGRHGRRLPASAGNMVAPAQEKANDFTAGAGVK